MRLSRTPLSHIRDFVAKHGYCSFTISEPEPLRPSVPRESVNAEAALTD